MRTSLALKMLGGTVMKACGWIGVVDMAVRKWGQAETLKPPTRDRVIAAVLRKAAAEARGITAGEWWADAASNNARLEHALEHHYDRFVVLFEDIFNASAAEDVGQQQAGTSPQGAATVPA